MSELVCLRRATTRLIPYGREHDTQTVEWLNTPELRNSFGFSGHMTLDSHRRWVKAARNVLIWAILDERSVHCGNALLHSDLRHRSAYFQIYLGEGSARGRGIGRAALHAVLDYAFGPLALHRVWLHTLPDNAAAERLYAAAGFVREGVERDAVLRDGAFRTQHRWSLLHHEWLARGKG
jgi:RimJ/RimL family protein N-acetyltransferase